MRVEEVKLSGSWRQDKAQNGNTHIRLDVLVLEVEGMLPNINANDRHMS